MLDLSGIIFFGLLVCFVVDKLFLHISQGKVDQ